MEIRLVARLPDPVTAGEDHRQAFWNAVFAKYRDFPSKGAEFDAAGGEHRVRTVFPQKLSQHIATHVGEASTRSAASSAPALPGNNFMISVRSLDYGSLEILLTFLAGNGFPFGPAEVVQLLSYYAPLALREAFDNRVAFAVDVVDAQGTLQGFITTGHPGPLPAAAPAPDAAQRASYLNRIFLWANFSLVVPVLLALFVCYETYRVLQAELAAAHAERAALLQERLALTSAIDRDRSQILKDALELVRESRRAGNDQKPGGGSGPGSGTGGGVPGSGAGGGSVPGGSGGAGGSGGTMPPLAGRPVLNVGGFTIFGTGPTIDFGQLAKDLVSAAGPENIRKLFEGIAEGVKVGRETVGLAADIWELYRKIWPEKPDAPPPPPPPPNVPVGTLLDRQVTFAFGSSELDPDTQKALVTLAERLRKTPAEILVEGHADGVGDRVANIVLSQQRAEAVRRFLVTNGIVADSIRTHGYGQGYFWLPFVPNAANNRRVRIIECKVGDLDRCARSQTAEVDIQKARASAVQR